MSAFGDCVVQCRTMLNQRFGTDPKVIHLRVLGASLLFLGGYSLLGGHATVKWAVGYTGFCFGWVVAPSQKDLERVYGEPFVGRVRALLLLVFLFAILAFAVFIVALSTKLAASPSGRPGFRLFCGLIVVASVVGAIGMGRTLRRSTKA